MYKKMKNTLALILCSTVAFSAVAGDSVQNNLAKDVKRSVSQGLDYAHKGVWAAVWGLLAFGGLVGTGYMGKICIWDTVRGNDTKQGKMETCLGGGVFCLITLVIAAIGLHGLKKMVDEPEKIAEVPGNEKEVTFEDQIEKQVKVAVNGAKKAGRFGAKLAGWSAATLIGLVLTISSVGATTVFLKDRNYRLETSLQDIKNKFVNGKNKEAGKVIGAGIAGVFGLPLLGLGIRGLIKTLKGDSSEQPKEEKKETKEIAIQTDDLMLEYDGI